MTKVLDEACENTSELNEVKNQKRYNINETTYLRQNEMKCPYCRVITPKLMPYIPYYSGVHKIYGVNAPKHFSMDHRYCKWKFKSNRRTD